MPLTLQGPNSITISVRRHKESTIMKTARIARTMPLAQAAFAAPVSTVESVALSIGSTLLETVQAFDGSHEARYNLAHDALTSAYTKAFKYGDKRELNAVLKAPATGKGSKCVAAMQTAIKAVDQAMIVSITLSDSRNDKIASAVSCALDVFASLVCVTKAKTVKAPAKTVKPAVAKDQAQAPAQNQDPVTVAVPSIDLDFARSLDTPALIALIDLLSIELASRTMPMLKAA